ncbi:MAG TPA: hypothetical protein VN944_02505 [Nitrospiria bacterium]|nr:hypothetical protein [Nitrospiria bacterium]
MNMLKVINFWVHLVSGFFYIGGIFFFYIVLPQASEKYVSLPAFRDFLEDLHDRFQKIAGLFITLLLFSGSINIHFAREARGGSLSNGFIMALTLKIFLFSILLTHYLLIIKEIFGREAKVGIKEIPFRATTFLLGFLILLMAASLKFVK